MIRRHARDVIARAVGVDQIVHVAAERVAGIVHARERQAAVKQVRAAEDQVRGVLRAHGAAEGHDHFLMPVALAGEVMNLRHELVHDVMEPGLVALDAPAVVAALVGPGLAVDGVDGEDHDLARVDPRTEDVVHVEAFKIHEAAGLAGDEQHRLAAMAVDLHFHVAAQAVGIVLEIADFHSYAPFEKVIK